MILQFPNASPPTPSTDTTSDLYEAHFGPNIQVHESKRTSADDRTWKTSKGVLGRLGNVVQYTPEESSGVPPLPAISVRYLNKIIQKILQLTSNLGIGSFESTSPRTTRKPRKR